MFETSMFYDLMEKLQHKAHANSQAKGFWTGPENENIPTKIALLHSELSEMLEAFRSNNPACTKTEVLHGGEYEGKVVPISILTPSGRRTMTNMEEEAADAFIRLLDLCEYLKINLAQCTLVKMRYNETRPVMHGGKKV